MTFKKILSLSAVLGLGVFIGLGLHQLKLENPLLENLSAQSAVLKVGIVDTEAVFAAHPLGQKLSGLQTQANKEFEPLVAQIKALQAKGDKTSAKEKQDLESALKLLEATQGKWNKQSDAVTEPLNAEVNKLLADTARANGFGILLSRAAAARTGLVVFADISSTDITETVVKALKK
jgi:outer membrane protein